MTLTKEMCKRVFPGCTIVPSEAAKENRDENGRLLPRGKRDHNSEEKGRREDESTESSPEGGGYGVHEGAG